MMVMDNKTNNSQGKLQTELEEAKVELQKNKKELKELKDRKDEFISMAAHELRAPMTAIKGYISMVVEGGAGDIPEKARGFLADASAITERVIRLVNNMVNVSRIEEGRMVYQMEAVRLSRLIHMSYNQFKVEAQRKGLDLIVNMPREVKDEVKADPDRLLDIIGNLVSNAVKYTNHGSVIIRTKQPSEAVVRLEVVDTGPGISEKEQDKLFRKFYRVESHVGKTIGTGLGLYISKLLIKEFKGRMGVNSEVGKGSMFWFELPLLVES